MQIKLAKVQPTSISGRRATPLEEYLETREAKLRILKELYSDAGLTVAERRRWRAQYFSLKKRVRDRITAFQKT